MKTQKLRRTRKVSRFSKHKKILLFVGFLASLLSIRLVFAALINGAAKTT